MNYGIIFWVTVIALSTLEGMKTWTWFDERCLRVYAKIVSTVWYLEWRLSSVR